MECQVIGVVRARRPAKVIVEGRSRCRDNIVAVELPIDILEAILLRIIV